MSLKRKVFRCLLKEKDAQATVEMAIVTPVLLVLALLVFNLMQFAVATARFDRIAPDIVLAHGVAPEGNESNVTAAIAKAQVQSELETAMQGSEVEVEVEVSEEGGGKAGSLLSMIGALRIFTCTMQYRPWPRNWSVTGVSLGAPVQLTHVRKVIVDPWRSGIVM